MGYDHHYLHTMNVMTIMNATAASKCCMLTEDQLCEQHLEHALHVATEIMPTSHAYIVLTVLSGNNSKGLCCHHLLISL